MVDNPIPNDLQADHLFLIIGGNPIPNWVAAKLLLKPNGQLYLIHGGGVLGTTSNALRLANKLQQNGQSVPELIEIQDVADAGEIYTRVRTRVAKIPSGQIALNYTGGTKAMAIHTYRAIEDGVKKGLSYPIFSYLDARTQIMVFDPFSSETSRRYYTVGLAEAACLDLRTLCEIHEDHTIQSMDLEITHAELRDPAQNALVEISSKNFSRNIYKNWRIEYLHSLNNKNRLKSEEALKDIDLAPLTKPPLAQLGHCLAGGLGQEIISFDRAAQNLQFPTQEDLAAWLDGGWLEDYVFECVEEIKEACQLQSLAKNIVIRRVRQRSKNPTLLKFQLDAAAMKGYSLYVFSCYSGNSEETLREHLIEAVLRARQMGGDEAHVALISPTPDVTEVEDQVAGEMDAIGKLRVFGMKELRSLSYSFSQWINAM